MVNALLLIGLMVLIQIYMLTMIYMVNGLRLILIAEDIQIHMSVLTAKVISIHIYLKSIVIMNFALAVGL